MSDEDKKWLTQVIAESEERNRSAMKTEVASVKEDIRKEIAASEERSSQRIERVETNLLTAFHSWASPVDQKLRSHREALRALDLQIEEIAGRVQKLEAARDSLH